ncbi:MAG: hypothetical protein L0387_02600, partial [Acidobacteria bacterium]|nr:hypothetical protein [Acidobacteriota bacterium]
DAKNDPEQVKALKQEVLDLKITNRGKDYFIEQLQKEREGFGLERQRYVGQLMEFNRKVGELSAKLLLLGGAANSHLNAPAGSTEESMSTSKSDAAAKGQGTAAESD